MKPIRITRTREVLRNLPFVAFIGLLIAFTWYVTADIRRGPTIIFASNIVEDGYNIINGSEIQLQGITDGAAFFYLFNSEEPLFIDGSFDFTLYMPPGLSRIPFRVTDQFHREKRYVINVYSKVDPLDSQRVSEIIDIIGTRLQEDLVELNTDSDSSILST